MTRASRRCAPISSAVSPPMIPEQLRNSDALHESVANEADAILKRTCRRRAFA